MKKTKKKEVTNEELARMVAKGFAHVDKRFDEVDNRFEHVDKRFEQVDERFEKVDERFEQVDRRFASIEATLSTMRDDINGIHRDMVYKDEMEDLMARVKYVEMKLGIDSGK
jgi:archaellum component FlaC